MLYEIIKNLNVFNINEHFEISPFKSLEDGQEYNVWLLSSKSKNFVLKKSSKREISVYKEYLSSVFGTPAFIASTQYNGDEYILIEYVNGNSLTSLNKEQLAKIIYTLAHIQNKFWQTKEKPNVGISYEESLTSRINRGKYLLDSELERVYDKFLNCYKTLPKTLCHDDLLPFNALIGEDMAFLIDWEVAGILPYPTPIARLIAHAEEDKNCFFFMTNEAKKFAIDLYYNLLLKERNISYEEYISTLNLFIFYEYCEWIMVGNKYKSANMDLYNKYLNKAKQFIIDNKL